MFEKFRTIPFSRLRSHFPSSVTSFSSLSSQQITATNTFVDYLINSLGFHKDEAVAISSEVPHLKSTANSDLVVNTFKNYGLDNVQIRNIVSFTPKILTTNPYTTLEPKLRVFQELGLLGSDLVQLVKRDSGIFRSGLHTQIIPTLNCLRKLVGCDEKVVEMINRSKWLLFSNSALRRMTSNKLLLKKYGLSDEKILMLLVTKSRHMQQAPELFESKLQYVEGILGISPNSPIFVHGLIAVMYRSESQIQKNVQVFRSFGWSDSEIATLHKAQPYCLDKSEDYITDKLKFFMNELKYAPSYLMGCTSFWTLSLENRMKPRNEVFKILKERELIKDTFSFSTIVKYSESRFLGLLKGFESHMPSLCETYKNSIRNSMTK